MHVIYSDSKDNRNVARLKGIDWVDGEAYLHLSSGTTLVLGEKSGEFNLKTVSGHRRIITLEFKNTDVNGDLILTGSNPQYVDLHSTEMNFRRMYDVIELYYTEELTETN
jgi:hypothetical protein